jgi:hypothetical protein
MHHAVVTRDPFNMVLIPTYSQLPSTSGDHVLHLQSSDRPYSDDRNLHDIFCMGSAVVTQIHQTNSCYPQKPEYFMYL